MKGLLAVARRTIVERRSVLAAAIIGSLVPFVVPLGRGMSGVQAQEARTLTAFILSSVFLAALTAVLGATMLPSRIADSRISFDLSRPISPWELWFGSLSAAVLLAFASAALVWLPSKFAGSEIPWRDLLAHVPVPSPLLLIPAIPVFFALSFGVSVALRSRSVLLLVDALLLAGSGVAIALIARLLLRHDAREALQTGLLSLAVIVAVLLIAAGGVSLARGRADIRQAHRAYSATLWPGVLISLLLLGGWAAWVLSAGPADMSSPGFVSPAPRGSWMSVYGRARNADVMFLFDETTRRSFRIPHRTELVFSEDGTRAAWLDPAGHLMTLRLDEPSSNPERTGISAMTRYGSLTLSPDGSRAAIEREGIVTVHAVAGGRAPVSARIAGRADAVRMLFVDGERIRVYAWSGSETGDVLARIPVRILELDARRRRLEHTGTIETLGWPRFLMGPGAARLLVRDTTSFRVVDARSGVLTARLAGRSPGEWSLPAFLSDGRVALATGRSDGERLSVFGLDGSLERSVELPPGGRVGLGGEVAPGQIVVGLRKGDDRSGDVFLVDAGTGRVTKIADKLWPVSNAASYYSGPLRPPRRPGSPAAKLFFGPQSSLVRFDPLTGERRTILGGEGD